MQQDSKLYENYRKWNPEKPKAQKGFIVAADLSQEWLLPWWWDHYAKYNDLPVAFVDLGLSEEMKKWCEQRGYYIKLPVPDIFVSERNTFSSKQIQTWEEAHGSYFWESRNAWFKKPLACLQTPFELSVWIDLDCEIKGSLSNMFTLPLPPSKIALAKEYHDLAPVNSGVILFQKGAPVMESWAIESLDNNHAYVGDQDILYALIAENKFLPGDLPLIYNWSRFSEVNREALVIHWHGNHGKAVIAHQIQKEAMKQEGLLC